MRKENDIELVNACKSPVREIDIYIYTYIYVYMYVCMYVCM
jgi:hypothetical protein